jgi:hypothetical protein
MSSVSGHRMRTWPWRKQRFTNAEKSLQFLDTLRDWKRIYHGGVLGLRGGKCCQNHVTKKFLSWNGKITFFEVARPLAAKAAKKCFQVDEGCPLIRRPAWRSTRFQTGLVFRPPGVYTITPRAAEYTPKNRFSPTLRVGFCMPWAGSSFPASSSGVPTAPAETASKDQPLTSPPPRPALGG